VGTETSGTAAGAANLPKSAHGSKADVVTASVWASAENVWRPKALRQSKLVVTNVPEVNVPVRVVWFPAMSTITTL
jgi:hypothetical protein